MNYPVSALPSIRPPRLEPNLLWELLQTQSGNLKLHRRFAFRVYMIFWLWFDGTHCHGIATGTRHSFRQHQPTLTVHIPFPIGARLVFIDPFQDPLIIAKLKIISTRLEILHAFGEVGGRGQHGIRHFQIRFHAVQRSSESKRCGPECFTLLRASRSSRCNGSGLGRVLRL